jgi:RNA polymerase sigma factor (sigma-70 family)
MGGTRARSPEPALLRARAWGEVSADQALERWHALYAPAVRAFVALRVRGPEAEDLVQDVWTIFYERWRRWEHRPEMEAAEARPVLSFLYRTCHFAVMGHRRRTPREEPAAEIEDGRSGEESLVRDAEAGRCLELARRILPPAELDVLLAKLASVPAREIARALGITESAVDHRFRGGLARLRARLRPRSRTRKVRHA